MQEWKPDERFFQFLRERVGDKDKILKRLMIVLANIKEESFDLEKMIKDMEIGSDGGRILYKRLYEINPVVMDMYKEYKSDEKMSNM